MLIGQLIFRSVKIPTERSGCRMMMVCGIIAVPSNLPVKDEHQYVITGNGQYLYLHVDSEVNLTEQIVGMGVEGILKSPLWRV